MAARSDGVAIPVPPCRTSGTGTRAESSQLFQVQIQFAPHMDVDVADAHGQQIHSRLAHKSLGQVRIGELSRVLHASRRTAGQFAQLRLDRHVSRMGVNDNPFHTLEVVVVRATRVRRHDQIESGLRGREHPGVDRTFIEDQAAGHGRRFRGRLSQRSVESKPLGGQPPCRDSGTRH